MSSVSHLSLRLVPAQALYLQRVRSPGVRIWEVRRAESGDQPILAWPVLQSGGSGQLDSIREPVSASRIAVATTAKTCAHRHAGHLRRDLPRNLPTSPPGISGGPRSSQIFTSAAGNNCPTRCRIHAWRSAPRNGDARVAIVQNRDRRARQTAPRAALADAGCVFAAQSRSAWSESIKPSAF